MIISLHVPKTAGTRFANILSQNFGKGLAFFYGYNDPRTHPLLRRRPKDFDAQMLAELEDAGVKVIHGHVKAKQFVHIVPDPTNYWIFLREPIEHTISHYHFIAQDKEARHVLYDDIRSGRLTLTGFAELPRNQGLQARHCEPFNLDELGFVGISEQFEASLRLLGFRDTATATNNNRDKPLIPLDQREVLAQLLYKDLAFYSAGLELVMRRLGKRERRTGAAAWINKLSGARIGSRG